MQQLPLNCEASYWREFIRPEDATALFHALITDYDVTDKSCKMADGTIYESETGTFIFADANLTSFDALPEVWGGRAPWPDLLAVVRDRIQDTVGVRFQVARLVYYANGSEGMSFHADLPAYGPTDAIASISLGAERDFAFRSLADPNDVHRITLHDGSLLYMGENCQERYQHGLPRSENCLVPRINLTFRKYGWT